MATAAILWSHKLQNFAGRLGPLCAVGVAVSSAHEFPLNLFRVIIYMYGWDSRRTRANKVGRKKAIIVRRLAFGLLTEWSRKILLKKKKIIDKIPLFR